MALAFQKLNLAAIHEQQECQIHFHCILELREGTDLLMVESSLVKWHKCLGCQMVVEKGTCMDVNLSNIVMVYSAVVVVMKRIVHKTVRLSTKNKQNQNSMKRDSFYFLLTILVLDILIYTQLHL